MKLLIYIVLAAAFGFVVFFVSQADAFSSLSNEAIVSIVILVIWLIWIGRGALSDYQGQIGKAIKDFGIWALIFVVLVVGYSFKKEVNFVYTRVLAEIFPSMAVDDTENKTVVFRRGENGHFNIETRINGQIVEFLVDTGASSVVLSNATARRIGVDTEELNYTRIVSTANGSTTVAPLLIPIIRMGEIELTDVKASISRPGDLEDNLLGLSALNRLESYTVSGDELIFQY